MELRIEREALGRELAILSKAVERKPTIPVYGDIHVVAEIMQPLRLETTDGSVAIRSTALSSSITNPGSTTIPALRLSDMVRAMVGAEVLIKKSDADNNGSIRVSCGSFAARLGTHPAEDFPKIAEPEGQGVVLPVKEFARMIDQTRYACASGDSRWFLNGALLEGKGGIVSMAATDAHRLAVSSWAQDVPIEPVLIPAPALDALSSLLDNSDAGTVSFGSLDNHLFFVVGGRTLISRRIDGKFPPYEKIIPAGSQVEAIVPRVALMDAMKRMMLVSSGARVVDLAFGSTGVALSCGSAEIGDATEKVESKHAGPDVALRLGGNYVIEALSKMSTDSVSFELSSDPMVAAKIRDANGALSVIMPMR